jgi:hypothetical protein
MRYETLTLGGNVVRFPVELRARPSIDLLIDVAPDSREEWPCMRWHLCSLGTFGRRCAASNVKA